LRRVRSHRRARAQPCVADRRDPVVRHTHLRRGERTRRPHRRRARASVTLRVLWLIKGLGPGGAERLLVEHAASGAHDGFEYEAAYVLDWKQHLVPELEAAGVHTHCLGVRSELDPRWAVKLQSLLRHGAFDVVHAHSPFVASVARVETRTLPRARRPA